MALTKNHLGWLSVLALVSVACSSDPSVESGSGPSAQATTASSTPTTQTSRTTAAPAEPKISEYLTLIGGTVDIPLGDPGKLAVVLTGASRKGVVPVVVRNRTTDVLTFIKVTGTARGRDGNLIGSGSSQLGFKPANVNPGEWAFGYVYFDIGDAPAETTFDLTAKGDPPSSITEAVGLVDLNVQEVQRTKGQFGNNIVGIVANPITRPISGPIGVDLICFTGNVPIGTHSGFTASDSVAPKGTASFSIDISTGECPVFAIGSSGRGK